MSHQHSAEQAVGIVDTCSRYLLSTFKITHGIFSQRRSVVKQTERVLCYFVLAPGKKDLKERILASSFCWTESTGSVFLCMPVLNS